MKFRDFFIGTAFLLVLATCCAGVFWFVLHSREAEGARRYVAFNSMKGAAAPAFSVTALDGSTVSSSSRPMVLEVFATWCEICTAEIPVLNRLEKAHPDVTVVAVTGSNKDENFEPQTTSALKRYRVRRDVAYRLSFDPSTHVSRDYKVVGFPSIYVIDKRGNVSFNQVGAVDYAALDQAVKAASM